MKKLILAFCLLFSISTYAVDATPWTKVRQIESRSVDVHDIYVEATIPSQNCTHNDRALIDVSTAGGKAMLSVALAALMSGKEVMVKVSGCLGYAPRAITILIRP